MLAVLEAVALPQTDAMPNHREVAFYAYTEDEEGIGESVRDANNALKVVRNLTLKDSSWREGEPPREPGYVPLWDIAIRIFGSHAKHAKYQVDYRKLLPTLPLNHISVMMDTYHAVKRAFKKGRKSWQQKQQARRERKLPIDNCSKL